MAKDRYELGLEMVGKVNGPGSRAIKDALAETAPDFYRWMIESSYGGLFARPGLGLREREIATIAALTAMGDVRPQLEAHIQGGLNVGLSREEIVEVIMQMAIYAGVPKALNALLSARDVFARQESAPSP